MPTFCPFFSHRIMIYDNSPMFLYSYDRSIYQYTICWKFGSFDNSEYPIAALIEVGGSKNFVSSSKKKRLLIRKNECDFRNQRPWIVQKIYFISKHLFEGQKLLTSVISLWDFNHLFALGEKIFSGASKFLQKSHKILSKLSQKANNFLTN